MNKRLFSKINVHCGIIPLLLLCSFIIAPKTYSQNNAGGTDQYDHWVNTSGWDFTVDDDRNGPGDGNAFEGYRWWSTPNNNEEFKLMELDERGLTLYNTSPNNLTYPTLEFFWEYKNTNNSYPVIEARIKGDRYTPLVMRSSKFHFETGSGTPNRRMTIDINGNVGIGTDMPSQPLDVNGKVRIRNLDRVASLDTSLNVVLIDENGDLKKTSSSLFSTSSNQIDLGQNIAGREFNAGKIEYLSVNNSGYTSLPNETGPFLNINGAGNTLPQRKIKLWGEGGVFSNGNIIMSNKHTRNGSDYYGGVYNLSELAGFDELKFKIGSYETTFDNNTMTEVMLLNKDGMKVQVSDDESKGKLGFEANKDGFEMNLKNITFDYGLDSNDLAQVSINTDKKVSHAALTIAGSTYIGGKADLAASGQLDKFKPEYLNRYSLWVERGIVSEDFVMTSVQSWKDVVFDTEYKLRSLHDLEKFIKTNKHLPEIPTAAEVEKNGYSLNDISQKLLQKIEELTLYAIEQNKTIEQLQNELKQLKSLHERIDIIERAHQ